ncbi:MAG: CDP-alcohol phosphatidyltransferase family protein [Trueperaceae bacterium]
MPVWTFTLAGLVASVIAIAAAFDGRLGVATAAWIANRVLDALDGEVARTRGRSSDLGSYWDRLADHVVYALLPIGLAYAHPSEGVWIALAAMLASFYVNGASWLLLAATLEARQRRADAPPYAPTVAPPTGLIEGTETFLLFMLFLLLPERLPFLFAVTAVLVAVTALQRLVWASRVLHDGPGGRSPRGTGAQRTVPAARGTEPATSHLDR